MQESTFTAGSEHIISYLPLSHVATQLLDVFTTIACAGTCWFAQPDALKGSLLHTMKEVRPTIFLGVPRSVCGERIWLSLSNTHTHTSLSLSLSLSQTHAQISLSLSPTHAQISLSLYLPLSLRHYNTHTHTHTAHTHTAHRVWERIAESLQMVANSQGKLKSRISSWAKGIGFKGNYTKQSG